MTAPAATHARFGGMWIHRADWSATLAQRVRAGAISAAEAEDVRSFAANGFLILAQAAPHAATARFQRAIADGSANGNQDLLYRSHGSQLTRAPASPRPSWLWRIAGTAFGTIAGTAFGTIAGTAFGTIAGTAFGRTA